ncbi:unnamed protein product [Aphanomyces euteiches]|uniref:Uncharacterized protein n=1 Tax=Aphanomyces euteiches TaxID=100861 RepID=A0A6G0WIA3_9STRA|nr:hypothetical protein Ae201684_014929 [Aphanomyces euteiches]KAH9076559.1 hypothetical protein Ae201684P_010501 [Aphanomyces euteiches]KAH9150200.1 hypothetical protein AeRB84_006929 [Aphanomyces euteiches]KAH9157656.1 hypothetical protein AeRB84_000529 [Aphanomyces euteiches]
MEVLCVPGLMDVVTQFQPGLSLDMAPFAALAKKLSHQSFFVDSTATAISNLFTPWLDRFGTGRLSRLFQELPFTLRWATYYAAWNGRLDILEFIHAEYDQVRQAPDLLLSAAAQGHFHIIQFLLSIQYRQEKGHQSNPKKWSNGTAKEFFLPTPYRPLDPWEVTTFRVVERGDLATFQILLPNMEPWYAQLALGKALIFEHAQLVDVLLEHLKDLPMDPRSAIEAFASVQGRENLEILFKLWQPYMSEEYLIAARSVALKAAVKNQAVEVVAWLSLELKAMRQDELLLYLAIWTWTERPKLAPDILAIVKPDLTLTGDMIERLVSAATQWKELVPLLGTAQTISEAERNCLAKVLQKREMENLVLIFKHRNLQACDIKQVFEQDDRRKHPAKARADRLPITVYLTRYFVQQGHLDLVRKFVSYNIVTAQVAVKFLKEAKIDVKTWMIDDDSDSESDEDP